MGKIFKNMIPYWKTLIIVILLLFVQAWCDLSLPSYTSDIIDVGIMNQGVEHIVPEAVTADEFELAKLLMTEEEATAWEDSYEADGDIYVRTVTEEEKLDELDETLMIPLLMNYQMSAVEEETFRASLAEQAGMDAAMLDQMSIEQIGTSMGMELTTFEKEVEDDDGNVSIVTCVDMRQILQVMQGAGMVSQEQIFAMRDEMQKTVDTMGSSLVKSMGVAYAAECDAAAGLDIEEIQTSYLWNAGLKMVGMALIMGVATVLIGFFGAHVGAGIGRDLRGRIFKKGVGFSQVPMIFSRSRWCQRG